MPQVGPWVVFEDAFKHKPSLILQNLSYPDFKYFLESNFHDNDRFAELETWKPEYSSQLLEAVAQKAAGVFLWVHLVVRSLLAELVNGDRVFDMRRRLDFLPPDIEKLYERILKNLDPFYREHAFYIFQVVRAARKPPSLLCLSFADEGPELTLNLKVQPLDEKKKKCPSRIKWKDD